MYGAACGSRSPSRRILWKALHRPKQSGRSPSAAAPSVEMAASMPSATYKVSGVDTARHSEFGGRMLFVHADWYRSVVVVHCMALCLSLVPRTLL